MLDLAVMSFLQQFARNSEGIMTLNCGDHVSGVTSIHVSNIKLFVS